MAEGQVLSIDQGTTSTRAVVFDVRGRPVAQASEPLTQHFPRPGWVEHDPEEIWRAVCKVAAAALAERSWESSARQFEQILQDRCFVRASGAVPSAEAPESADASPKARAATAGG